MGKVEKIAVLSVLFLIAVILVVSLTTDNPIQTENAAVLGEKPAAAPGDTKTAALPEKPADPKAPPLLAANVKNEVTPQPAPAPAPALETLAVPTGSLLKSVDGLAKGYDDKRFVYTWKSGDSYVSLATRLYGEPAKFTLLKNANDGRDDVQPGEKILVPIYDVESVPSETPALAGKESAKPATKEGASKKKAPVASAAGRVHVVKKGESLWKIAKAELGDGNRWKDIYEVNRDKLKTPEALRDGMELKLP